MDIYFFQEIARTNVYGVNTTIFDNADIDYGTNFFKSVTMCIISNIYMR